MYKNEQKFSQALVTRFRSLGYQATRVESGTTGNGIPDLFVTTPKIDAWLELKRTHRKIKELPDDALIEIDWRPGQQAWMIERYIASGRKRWGWTMIAFNDCIAAVPHTKRYPHNTIKKSDLVMIWDKVSFVTI